MMLLTNFTGNYRFPSLTISIKRETKHTIEIATKLISSANILAFYKLVAGYHQAKKRMTAIINAPLQRVWVALRLYQL